MMSKCPICFQIKFKKKEYIEVFVWRTVKQFDEISGGKVYAQSITFQRKDETPKIGELHFVNKYWTWQTSMHELLHTAFGLYGRWKLEGSKKNNITEEILCRLFQRLVKEWCEAIWKAGFRV